jgi:purine-nucleoside phosphorylase
MTPDAKITAAFLKKESPLRPSLAMVLGSGFQHALDHMEITREIAYSQIPGFPTVGVTGHAGKLVFGHFEKTPVVALKGRVHYYEGYEMERLAFPIRALAEFGIRTLLLTNAAGGVNRKYRSGDFMTLNDHINFIGVNPLRGAVPLGLSRFVDLSRVYDRGLVKLSKEAASMAKMRWHKGIYLAVCGPTYETPAEIRAFRLLGADAVGMSTVPEAIIARQHGMSVAGISCITNQAGGDDKGGGLSHAEVVAMGESKKKQMAAFLKAFVLLYAKKKH